MMPGRQIHLLAERMVQWQGPYGRPDPRKCPFIYTGTLVNSMNFHSPTFMAIGLYKASDATGTPAYKEAADRYITAYLASLRNPVTQADHYTKQWIKTLEERDGPLTVEMRRWATNILQWPFIYGMALAGYRYFREYNPDELAFESKAAAVYDWLNFWRWNEGSYYRNGYGSLQYGILDAGNSDDNCHMGRGLVGYHAVSGREDALADAEGLARYYLTEAERGTYKGCWLSKTGTWVIAPTINDNFEHLVGTQSDEASWGFSSIGAIEYLTELARFTGDAALRGEIASKCASSMRWQFDACQFDDGAVGMTGQDDKWLGMAAGAMLSYIWTRDAGFLSNADTAAYGARARAAREWMIAHVTPEQIDAGGYIKVTGRTEPRPPDNLAWLFGTTLRGLCMADRL
jgi:hypothetical protein